MLWLKKYIHIYKFTSGIYFLMISYFRQVILSLSQRHKTNADEGNASNSERTDRVLRVETIRSLRGLSVFVLDLYAYIIIPTPQRRGSFYFGFYILPAVYTQSNLYYRMFETQSIGISYTITLLTGKYFYYLTLTSIVNYAFRL